MFVMNLTDTELVYSTNGNRIRLFPGTVTEIEDSIVSPEKLKGCYGNMIDIIGEDRVAKIRQELEAPVEEHVEVLDTLFNNAENVIQKELGNTETGTDKEVDNTTDYWKAKTAEADAYFADLKEDNDSDKHLKLEISERLVEEAFKEDRYYDSVSLMEEIERIFPEEKAKLIAEVEAATKGNKTEEVKDGETSKEDNGEVSTPDGSVEDNKTEEVKEEGKDGETSKEGTENDGEVSAPDGKVADANKETVKNAPKNKAKGNSKKSK